MTSDAPHDAAAETATRSLPTAPTARSWVWSQTLVEESPAAAAAREKGAALGATPIGRGAADALTVLAAAAGARAVVEIGSGAGVSGLALFAGMRADGVLTSVDIEPEHQHHAREAFTEAGIAPQRYRLINGAALNVLPKLSDASYDLVLVDGDELEYVEYVDQAQRLLRPGGLLVLDHALWHDRVADPENEDDETIVIREAIEAVLNSGHFTAAVLPSGDGLLVAVKNR